MNYYQFNIGDYRKDAGHLSLLEHGIYRMLIDTYYTNEGPLVADDAKLMRSHCVRIADEVQAYKNIIADFFIVRDGMYYHSGCEKVLEEIFSKSAKARASSKARWDRKNKGLHQVDANAMRTDSERNANGMLPNTQYPIPNTQYNKVKKAPSKLVKPTIHELITEFGNRVTDSETQAEKFLAYYESNGWKIGKNPMKSWRATVTTWVTRSKENANHGISAITGFSTPGSAGKISTVDRNGIAADNYRRKLQLQYEAEDQHNGHVVGASGSDVWG